MAKDWYSIEELSCHLDMSEEDIERLLLLGELIPSIFLPSTNLLRKDYTAGDNASKWAMRHGIFEIVEYEKLRWRYSSGGYSQKMCDIPSEGLQLRQDGQLFKVRCDPFSSTRPLTFSMNDLVITAKSVAAYQGKKSDYGAATLEYLDSAHPFHSKELAAAVEVWMILYGDGEPKPGRGHKDQIKAHLTGRGFSREAIERIATVVNPNKKGGAPVTS